MVLLVSHAVDSYLLERQLSWLDKSDNIVNVMVSSGNGIAESRKCEMKKLEGILGHFISEDRQEHSGHSGAHVDTVPSISQHVDGLARSL
jgi:hypothetical protein